MKTKPMLALTPNIVLRTIAVALLGLVPVAGNCDTISFDTGTAAGWKVNAGGAIGANPYVISISDISLGCLSVTSDGRRTGTFLPGGSLANFDGFWSASYTFYLPANATGVSLTYGTFFADDRAVINLNGNILNATGVPWSGSPGQMVFTQGGAVQAYSPFNGPNGSVSGSTTAGFILGGLNTFQAIVNNTYSGIYGPLAPLIGADRTDLGLAAIVSYSVIPEPGSASIFGLGLVGLLRAIRRRN